MKIHIITLKPYFWYYIKNNFFLFKKAIEKKKLILNINNLKNYGIGNNKKIDDYQYGGGYGMILKIEPIYNCIKNIKKTNKINEIIYLTPNTKLFNQKIANNLSKKKNIIFICGHYKGIDQRLRNKFITKEYSIGNYILSNGEFSTLIVIDTIIRLLPGIFNNNKSIITDSLYKNNKNKFEYPLFTRPYIFKNLKVPKILLSGNHKKILNWRKNKIKKFFLNKKKGTK
ncbi:MAG: tRNA (guanosine(37)-N1)-methyltransferase TrmD [Candidatus Shikimatogenerans sp. JK-2022]|nr:tRNA (guanosine(37)-N1)-methyltransferase TrmD [Candidatus Shikimatogenerans bostrichidophilus]